MVKLISVQCPQCGAGLEIEEERKMCFCTYCGTKIMVDDGDNSFTYRKIDEARIREAEVTEKIRLKELEIESSKNNLRNAIIIFWVISIVIIGVTSFVILHNDKDNKDSPGYLLLIIDFISAMWLAIFLMRKSDKDDKIINRDKQQ